LLRNPNQGSSTPSKRSGTPPAEAVSAGEHATPLVPVQDRSARPKPKRQHPKALKRRKRRLRENPDWVKLEPAASCEPPRHQQQYGTEAPNRATAASTQESMPSEEAYPRNAEAIRKFELAIAYQRHAILDTSSKLPSKEPTPTEVAESCQSQSPRHHRSGRTQRSKSSDTPGVTTRLHE
jgi:hypothetical protein